METIVLNGVEISVVRKNIKNMYLRVNREGRAVISCPTFMPKDVVQGFAESKADWLSAVMERRKNALLSEKDYSDGEERTLLGRPYTLRLDTTRKSGFYFKGNDIILCVGKDSTRESRKKALAKVYREAMEQILPEIAQRCEEASGLRAKEWRIRDMKTRWGSCNTKEERIWINLWLVEKNPICIRAVVCHELAHLKIKGHNKEFYKLVESICPDYARADELLKNRQ